MFPRLKLSGGGSTTANCWLSIGGQYGETEQIQLPKHTLDVTIKVVISEPLYQLSWPAVTYLQGLSLWH